MAIPWITTMEEASLAQRGSITVECSRWEDPGTMDHREAESRIWGDMEEVDPDRVIQISIKTFLTVVESTLVAIISLRSEVLVGLGAMELES